MLVVHKLTSDYQNGVTTVICRKIKTGHEKDYNYWIRRYLELERKAPGYLGTTIIIAAANHLFVISSAVLLIKMLLRHGITQKNH